MEEVVEYRKVVFGGQCQWKWGSESSVLRDCGCKASPSSGCLPGGRDRWPADLGTLSDIEFISTMHVHICDMKSNRGFGTAYIVSSQDLKSCEKSCVFNHGLRPVIGPGSGCGADSAPPDSKSATQELKCALSSSLRDHLRADRLERMFRDTENIGKKLFSRGLRVTRNLHFIHSCSQRRTDPAYSFAAEWQLR